MYGRKLKLISVKISGIYYGFGGENGPTVRERERERERERLEGSYDDERR